MRVSVQYAKDHFAELLELAEKGQDIDVDRDGQPVAKIIVMQSPAKAELPKGKRILGAGVGEIILPTDEEWKAMDKELEDIMVNGPLFPNPTA